MVALFCLALSLSPVSIKAGFYSYPQLAAELSRDGERVACDPDLGNRLAFVSIHSAERPKVMAALGETLGVSFAKRADGSELMLPDQTRLREEAKQLDRLVKWYGNAFSASVKGIHSLAPVLTPGALKDRVDELEKESGAHHDDSAAAQVLLDLQDGTLSPLTFFEIKDGIDFSTLLRNDAVEVGNELDLERVELPAWQDVLTRNTVMRREVARLKLPADQMEAVLRKIALEGILSQRLSFDPLTGSVAAHQSFCFRPDSGTGGVTDTLIVPEEIPIAYPSLKQLSDEEPAAALKARQDRTQEWLASAEGGQKLEMPGGSNALSEVLWAWSRQNDRDVVMQVSLSRDISPNQFLPGKSRTTSLKEEFSPGPPAIAREQTSVLGVSYSQSTSEELQRKEAAFGHERTYSVNSQSEILEVRSEFGFLDHVCRFPASAVADFANNRWALLGEKHALAPSLQAVLAYCSKVSPEADGLISRFQCALIPNSLSSAYPIFRHAFASAAMVRLIRRALAEAQPPIPPDVQHTMPESTPQGMPLDEVPGLNTKAFCADLSKVCAGSEYASSSTVYSMAVSLDPSLDQYLSSASLAISAVKNGERVDVSILLTTPRKLVVPNIKAAPAAWYDPPTPTRITVLWWLPVQISASGI